MQSCRTKSGRQGGFAEAVADGVVKAAGWWEWAEDDFNATLVQIAQAGEKVAREGCGVGPVSPVEKVSSCNSDPAIGQHQPYLFAGLELELTGMAEAEFQLILIEWVDQNEVGTGRVVADANAG